METLQPLLDAFAAKHGWTISIVSVIGTARLLAKPFSTLLQTLMARAFAIVQETNDSNDDEFIAAMLKARWYRVLAFLLDLTLSIKLPRELPLSGLRNAISS